MPAGERSHGREPTVNRDARGVFDVPGGYIALGLFTGVAFCVPVVLMDAVLLQHGRFGAVIAIGLVYGLFIDVLLTFVTPALAYTTRSVREALRIGIRMITSTWPHSAGYVLTPGLVFVSFSFLLHSRAAALPVAAVASVIALWFKGAVAAFYLRVHPETDGFGA